VSRWLRDVRRGRCRSCRRLLCRLRTIGNGCVGVSGRGDCGRRCRNGLGLRSSRCLDHRCFRDRLDGNTATATAALGGGCGLGLRFRRWSGRSGSAAPTRRSRRSCDTRTLLTLPASADAGNLIITQRTEMAAHGYVHLTKESGHLVAGHAEFARQIMYSKLAQPISSLRPSGIGARLSA
jgi:hypothetical protein